MSTIRTIAFTTYTITTGALCIFGLLALLATHCAGNYTTPVQLNQFIYQVETPQGNVLLRDVHTENMWLVSFNDCQIPLTATTVATINGTKHIVEFRQELGTSLALTILRDVTNLKSFAMDVPCMEGVRSMNFSFRDHWTETE